MSDARARIREAVWDRLQAEGVARFPYPPHGRIPNFAGAREAAERLLQRRELRGARRIKVNPDAPQRPLRELALAAGIALLVPTPRLRGGFLLLDPARIGSRERGAAATLSGARRFGREVPLRRLPELDAIVVGSVAVAASGRRLGKGHGYADLEYAVLVELGFDPPPVLTSVHDAQLVPHIPRDPTDLPVSVIATPTRVLEVAAPPPPPRGLDRSRLSEADLAAMPVLREILARQAGPKARRAASHRRAESSRSAGGGVRSRARVCDAPAPAVGRAARGR